MDNTEKKRIKILNYRTGQGIAPKPENIVHGEIAIGYKKDNEAIYIKNSTDEIVDFTPTSIVNITYNKLKELRDNSKLKPSQYYRITDFVTTVANDEEAQSAGHPFDLIILATDKNKLQEECYAIQHEDDTYFANCNLAAWKIWYCLDNDNTKYAWADTVNGKGVIYRMIDEWGNDCPYDFKNVQFKRYWANGINTAKPGDPKNIILQGYYGTSSNANTFTEGIDTNDYLFLFTFTRLNNISEGYAKGSVTQSNVLDESIQTEGFDIDADDDKLNNPNAYHFHNRCRNNILKPTEVGLLVDTKQYMTFILLNNVFITVKIDDSEVYQSPFDNTLGVSCVNNTFGDDCYSNSFGNICSNNSFGNGYNSNSFGDYCYRNTFGDNCSYNSFGNYCSNNSFGNGYGSNSLGEGCDHNTFGEGCDHNTFGEGCYHNSFENYCHNNSFGNYCHDNSFGNYFQYNALGNDIEYIEIPTEKTHHTQILNGTKGTQSNKLTLEFTPETIYSQFAGFTSDNVLKIWVEADETISIVSLTYAELKELRNHSKLKPSQYYRITDFVTTVANDEEAKSAGHPFDLIILATDEDKLQEECYAIHHEGDEYFENCNLAAWKIWYCLDNDNTKYAWADTTNGKGVIYRMIDEWGNDCPYDFKNVQFKRYWANGINTAKTGGAKSIILQGYYGTSSNADTFTEGIDTNDYLFLFTFTRLNNISEGYAKGSVTQSNVLDESIQTEGFDIDAGKRCSNNILKPTETVLVVDTKKYMTFVLLNNVFITIKRRAAKVYQPPFDNTLGSNCYSNSFGNDCYGNSLGSNCYGNSFGNSCSTNSFGNNCRINSFGYNCVINSFENDCYRNSFGNGCGGNSFGNNCYGNSFGNGCSTNSFGRGCHNNSFGNNCRTNSFEDDCYINSFGNNFQYNTLGNGIQHVEITTDKIYHTQILNGTKGTWDNKLTLEFTPETTYSQFAGFTSEGVLKIWVEADAPNDTVDGGSY